MDKGTGNPKSIERVDKDTGAPDGTRKTDKDATISNSTEKSAKEKLREDTAKKISSKISDYITMNKSFGMTQASFADKIGASSSSVNRWASIASTDMPPVYFLKPIADEIGITVDSLLTGIDVPLAKPKYRTYADAFLSMAELIRIGVILPSSEDPFLNWLVYKKSAIDNMENVIPEKKEAWVSKVATDYNKPILPNYLTQYINLFLHEYEDIEEYDTYLTVFRLFQGYESGKTKEEVDGLIRRWEEAVKSGSDEFKYIDVPFWDKDATQIYALDENGKEFLVDKPKKEVYIEVDPDDIPVAPEDLGLPSS